MTQVAFIGIGAMGEPMAANLLKKDFAVTVVKHRRTEPATRLQAAGAKVVNHAAEAMRGSQYAVLCLPTSAEVELALAGELGLLKTAAAGSVVIDCTTGDPEVSRRIAQRLAEKNIIYVDAGLTRGVAGAKTGTLAYFIGGEPADIEKAMPVLKAMGDTFVRVGPVGHGHTAKVISNVLSYGTVALVNEAMMLGGRSGLDLKALFDALMQGAPSKALEAFGPRIVTGEYDPPRVTVDHVCDDMMLAQKLAAQAMAPIAMLGTAQEIYRQAGMRGDGARDMSIVRELWRK